MASGPEGVPGTVFNKEIQNMMHAFGDNPSPLMTSVELVDVILCEQLELLLHKAHEVTLLRGAKWIGYEDILFLMRKDRIKLNRLLNYLAIKDFKSSSLLNDTSPDSLAMENGTEKHGNKKRKQMCMEYLETIDQTGELTDKKQPFDAVRRERMIRAEQIAQGLDGNRYFEYAGARRTSFIYRYGKGNKIQEWLLAKTDKFPDLPRNNSLLYDILAYFAYETVAQTVDLALLVRQDGAAKPGDAFSYYVAGFNRLPGFYPSQYAAELNSVQLSGPPPLTPAEIREALRRYWSPQLCPWSPFCRSLPPSVYTKLLAC